MQSDKMSMEAELRHGLRQLPLRQNPSRADFLDALRAIREPDEEAARCSRAHWDSLCKPIGALGRMEELLVRLAAIQGQACPSLDRRAILLFAADHGIVEEGVSQTGQEVTAQVLRNISVGKSTVSLFARETGSALQAVDLGVAFYGEEEEHPAVLRRKIRGEGTRNFYLTDALSEAEMMQALFFGFDCARAAAEMGFRVLVAGEMGIGNTSAATALTAAILGRAPAELCGRGAGLSDQGLARKKSILSEALKRRMVRADEPFSCLRAFGGLEIAAMSGFYLGAARSGAAVILDGFVSLSAALLADCLHPFARAYFFAGSSAKERGAAAILEKLALRPFLDFDYALGEGAGALTLLPMLDLALCEFREMPCFHEGKVEAYERFSGNEQP